MKQGRHVAKLVDPELTLDFVSGQTRVMVLKSTPFRVPAGDERYMTHSVINTKELILQGKEVGTTVLNIWFGDKDDPARQETLTYLVRIFPEQQVALRVIVAEVSRAAARSIGLNFSVRNNQGVTVFSNNTGNVGLGGGGFGNALGGVAANITAVFDGGNIPVALNALRTLSYAKSLAEPTLVTLNGQTANFLAGGQFPVPVVTGFGNQQGLQGLSFVPFGVQLRFTPFITDRDRIRLQLNANVSSRDVATGTNIGGAAVSGLNARTVNTTVELRQGETLAVAGLIESNQGADASRTPLIGDVPFFTPFTSNRQSAGEKELVIFITPELVRPLDVGDSPNIPGCDILEPTDVEFYLLNRLEGRVGPYRSVVRTDWGRIRQFEKVERGMLCGPSGYCPAP